MRAEHLAVDPAGDTHTVDLTESLGGVSFVYLTCDTGERIVIEERGDDRSVEGARVGVTIDKSRLYLFDAQTETRIRTG
jgi:lactose/L-arabinose transport system ATP-binding protein